jgi:ubiquinone/menaquinone biosynthesis C-methylase UbiE
MRPYLGEVFGVEYNDGMLEQAIHRFGTEVVLQQGSAQNIPHAASAFDVVTLNQVIHHFDPSEDFQALSDALQECWRVLKPGGKLIVNTSTPVQQRDGFWWLSLFPEASTRICARFPPLETLTAKMSAAGFDLDADGVVVPLMRPLMRPDRYLDRDVTELALDEEYRACDSSWAMAVQTGELDTGLERLKEMSKDGSCGQWLQGRETLRLQVGQATFVIAKKPDLQSDNQKQHTDVA